MLFKFSAKCNDVEIWEWEEKETLEKVMIDYVKWMFRLDFCMPKYVITLKPRNRVP